MNRDVTTNRMQTKNYHNIENTPDRKVLILIVEDDKYMNETLREVLEDEGYNVESSLTVLEAVNKVKHSEKKFQLLILDYNLQFLSGVTGLDIFQIGREINPNVEGIMISAYGDKKIKEKAREKGIETFLDKPFKINELTDAVNAINEKITHNGNSNNFFYLN